MQIRKSQRQQAKLRIGLSWPSGSGKTYSALKMAKWLSSWWDKVVLIDTENGSGDLYSHLWGYMVLSLEAPFTPERYIEAIKACENAGAEVIVIDSTTHEWDWPGGCLEANDKTATTKFKWNTWSAWSITTPRHQAFIEAIITSSCHIITTARSKTETVQVEENGRKVVKKLGMKDIQREWFEYELTLSFNIDRSWHLATASKDRTGLFIDKDPFVIWEETGKEIFDWNESWTDSEEEKAKIAEILKESIAGSQNSGELKVIFDHIKGSAKQIGQTRVTELTELIRSKKEDLARPNVDGATSFADTVEIE